MGVEVQSLTFFWFPKNFPHCWFDRHLNKTNSIGFKKVGSLMFTLDENVELILIVVRFHLFTHSSVIAGVHCGWIMHSDFRQKRVLESPGCCVAVALPPMAIMLLFSKERCSVLWQLSLFLGLYNYLCTVCILHLLYITANLCCESELQAGTGKWTDQSLKLNPVLSLNLNPCI